MFTRFLIVVGVMNGTFSGLPQAWVVKRKKCGCTITCRAVDPQTEHAEPDKAEPALATSDYFGGKHIWTFRFGVAK